jgi:hypothetical protein
MNHIAPLLKTGRIAAAALLALGPGLTAASAQASQAVDQSQGYKAMSMKDDCLDRSRALALST